MGERAYLADVAKRAANAAFGSPVVESAHLDDMEGSDGDAVIRVRLIVADDGVAKLDGDRSLDAGSAIATALREAGEPLRVVVEYAEQRELDELGTH